MREPGQAMRQTLLRSVLGAAVFLALFLGTGYWFLATFAPKPLPAHLDSYRGYEPAAMEEALRPEAVRAEQEAILACGSRFLGQPGLERAADHLRARFAAAGMTVIEYPQRTAAPVTSRRAILGADGQPLPDVEIYPFMPNQFQPSVTPAEGVRGRLLLVSDEVLLAEAAFDDAIAVVDAARPPKAYGLSWIKYAQLGFRAVILAHREGFSQISWEGTTAGGMVASNPVNFVRLAATEGIFAHLGETVTLHLRVDWREVDNTTFVAYFPATGGHGPASEALVLTSCYDACSVLPDLAPGALGAAGVATQLSLLKGLLPYRDTWKRDVICISYPSQMMAQLPANGLVALLGPALTRREGLVALQEQQAEDRTLARRADAALACLASEGFFTDPAVAHAALAALAPEARGFLDEQVRYVMNSVAFELAEAPLRHRLAFVRLNTRDLTVPEFQAFTASKRVYDEVTNASGYPLEKLLAEKGELLARHDIPGRCLARLRELQAYHQWRGTQLERGLVINRLLTGYDRLAVLSAPLTPADPAKVKGEKVTLIMGRGGEGNNYRHSATFNDVFTGTYQRGHFASTFTYESLHASWHEGWANNLIGGLDLDTGIWGTGGGRSFGYPAIALINSDRAPSYSAWGYPVELPYMRDTDTLRESLRFAGTAVLALAHGEGAFDDPVRVSLGALGGRVFAANVGRSIVPNFPVKNALVGHKGVSSSFEAPGFYRFFLAFTDVYGRYSVPFAVANFVPWGVPGYSPEAVVFGGDGVITHVKDEGPAGQAVYKSMNLGWAVSRDEVNLVLFRASPVTLFDTVNPQTLSAFAGVGFVSRDGLSPLTRTNVFPPTCNGIVTAFLEPDRPFFVTLKAAAANNPLVFTTRGFLLNAEAARATTGESEIEGEGYLAYYTPRILQIPRELAASLQQVNGRRLALQVRYDMADERTQAFHAKGDDLLRDSAAAGLPAHQRHLLNSEAATYGILNHPVLRRSIYEAVVGILWYLGLLVPFVFFFEKLACGFADIRKQLAAQAIIFVAVFILLRFLHPAFEMIRSSLMILLGFVVMLVSGGVTLMFSAKFQENFEELRRRRGQVAAAEVNKFGVMATAFALGLNNMHRRKVRTGLTCATLVLITFAMICFTSVRSNLVQDTAAIGKAGYQGLLVKPRKARPISDSELFALQTRYSHLFRVCPRRVFLGRRDAWRNSCRNPEISLVYEPAAGVPKKLRVESIMTFSDEEPLRDRIRLLTAGGWLPERPLVVHPDDPAPVLVSELMAREMGITPEQVDADPVPATLSGNRVLVHGIFDSESLQSLRDIDDRDLLPFDVEAVRVQQLHTPEQLLAEDDDPRLSPARQVLARDDFRPTISQAELRLVSVAVEMPGLSYKQARAEIDRYLEQSGQETYFGLDGVAYFGKIARESSFAGLVEILIPLVIAAMTVLNTMRGSVYERRSEIYVYNAVGIAPRYIFGMFISEAVVYAVVGSVLGYLLSQGTGLLLTTCGWTGGLNMSFTSISTIYASLAIMVAVFVSTFFPARSAMEIAAPAEEAGWHLPPPDGDTLSFDLPFTFSFKDRVAVLAFFHRFLADHGEGSSGPFFAAPPGTGLSGDRDPLSEHGLIPEVRCTIWLKPFDLGVSQELVISTPTDPHTREFIARLRIVRLSGTRESWLRLNPPFVARLRQNFLYWRAVSLEERERLFEEARGLLRADLLSEGSTAHG